MFDLSAGAPRSVAQAVRADEVHAALQEFVLQRRLAQQAGCAVEPNDEIEITLRRLVPARD